MNAPDSSAKSSPAFMIFGASALLLGTVNLSFFFFKPERPDPVVQTSSLPLASQANDEKASDAGTSVKTPAAASVASFAWSPVESSDYKEYIKNLRILSFPEELIRELIISDVNKLYAPREEPLKVKQVPHDASLAQRRRAPTLEDVQNQSKLLEIQIEKQNVLQELLGIRLPRELLRTPNSRNYEGYEYAISQLPPEKQEAVQRIQEKVFLDDDLAQVEHSGRNVPAFREINQKRDEALQQILTPEEFEKYMMNSTPAGTEMARRTIGMEATDDEMLIMWRLTHQQWKEQGGVYEWWRADPVPPQKIKEADEKLAAGLRAALGEERYIDYQMAVSGSGQQLRNFAARYGLPRETLTKAFAVQTELDELARSARQPGIRAFAAEGAPIPIQSPRMAELQQQLGQVLGPDHFESWNAGRNQPYDLQP